MQLTNPNILDLTEWQKLVNEINYLSAKVDAIITGQGSLLTAATDWNSTATFSNQFNVGNQKILFGREKATVSDLTKTNYFYEGAINFSETEGIGAFKAKPIITATLVSTSSTLTENNPDLVVLVFNPTSTGFSFRLVNAGSHINFASNSTIYIHWIAIGPS